MIDNTENKDNEYLLKVAPKFIYIVCGLNLFFLTTTTMASYIKYDTITASLISTPIIIISIYSFIIINEYINLTKKLLCQKNP